MGMCKKINCTNYAELGKLYCHDCMDIDNIKKEAKKETIDKIKALCSEEYEGAVVYNGGDYILLKIKEMEEE